MENREGSGSEVIMAGLGGMGVLLAGQVLAWAALKQFKHVSYTPTYATQKRGGLCECTVQYSNEEVASPWIDQAYMVMLFDGSQFKTFEPRVRAGGVMLAESAGLQDKPEREDYELLRVPGLEVAVSMGDPQVNNLILLGTYVSISEGISPRLIERELEERFGNKKEVLKRNREAFGQGLELGRTRRR
jgi:2-oxoglutarate ferredoxin oxidoreductase subunit gamma